MPAKGSQEREVLRTYVEADLAAWVRAQANRSGHSTSSFLRFVLHRVRTEMAHDPGLGTTLGGGGTGHDAT
jgi:hypothetical protein